MSPQNKEAPDHKKNQLKNVDVNTLSAYDYHLPEELIAQAPTKQRDQSRLMHINRASGVIEYKKFTDLATMLKPGDLLIVNDTRVIPARFFGKKESGGEVEVFLSKRLDGNYWEALIRLGSGKPNSGMVVTLERGRAVLIQAIDAGLWKILIEGKQDSLDLIEQVGSIPLPPYIHREKDNTRSSYDRERYQTVYAKHAGAVAAPTAGLHFTDKLFADLAEKGVGLAQVTLHVGLGTFKPIREENLDNVKLHNESYILPEKTIKAINRTKADGGRVIAVGTTSVRVLEHSAKSDKWYAHEGNTELFLRPGSKFDIVDAMITNFHLPKSSLLMLVAAFASKELMDEAYRLAVLQKYRFFSYGDAMFIE